MGWLAEYILYSFRNVLNEKLKLCMASCPIYLRIPGLITRVSLSCPVWKHCYFCRRLAAPNTCETAVLTPVLTSYVASLLICCPVCGTGVIPMDLSVCEY